MGRHRVLLTRVRRRIAHWPVTILALVVLIALGWLGWTWLGGVLAHRAVAEAATCGQGDTVLKIAAAPSIADPLRDAAQHWADHHPIVYDRCVRIEVQSVNSTTVLAGLTKDWDSAKLGRQPDAWLPDSTLWTNELTASNPNLVGAQPVSIATSPIVLVGSQSVADVLAAKSVSVAELPDAVTDKKVKLAVLDPTTNSASALLLQSVLANGKSSVTLAGLAQQSSHDLLTRLAVTRAPDGLSTMPELLNAISTDTVGTARAQLAPVTEVDLYRWNNGYGQPKPPAALTEISLTGATEQADFPFVTLSGTWVESAQIKAAQDFRNFLQQPDQLRLFAAAGFRVNGTSQHPSSAPGMTWPTLTTVLTPADTSTTRQIAQLWATPHS